MNKLTPMMQQYTELKNNYKDSILLFRLGDFYETFFEDAKIASNELDLVLTGKDCGLSERAPMCGVPYHAVDSYIAKLVNKGYKVAICEQLENPTDTKGIVKRAVTRIITPGTVIEASILDEQENNYIVSICQIENDIYELAYCDISTGEFSAAKFCGQMDLLNELYRLTPKEAVIPDSNAALFLKILNNGLLRNIHVSTYLDWAFEKETSIQTLKMQFPSDDLYKLNNNGLVAAGALIQYLHDTQKNNLIHINKIISSQLNTYMGLDSAAIKNLELIKSIADQKKYGSLYWLMNKTETSLGARELKRQILHPEYNKEIILSKQKAIEELIENYDVLKIIKSTFKSICDLERIIARLSYEKINARDCLLLKESLKVIPELKAILSKFKSNLFQKLNSNIDLMEDVFQLLDEAINENSPLSITDGGIIKKGYNNEVDILTDLNKNAYNLLLDLEDKERNLTGIKNLKIRYNKVFGYFIEITKSYLNQVPYRYMRKQTLSNSERFITQELKELEENILSSKTRKNQLEYELFSNIRANLCENITRIQSTAHNLALLDVLQSMATIAYENDYVKPDINEEGIIDIKNSRHPVVEKILKEKFVSNDVQLQRNNKNLLLITGPNMAGKSTYMRQTALLVLMAHMGSYVPADYANICLTDRIFTRVGASDDLVGGQSTFMVEMTELANILKNATKNSLLILDEIGRGTSTIDGLSIARSSVEYIIKNIGANTLFSTHYHELIDVEDNNPEVRNCSIQTCEKENEIVFLHKITDGGTNKSFGIEVAQLSGIPKEVIDNAKTYLAELNNNKFLSSTYKSNENKSLKSALTLLQKANINNLSPIEALNILTSLKKELKNEFPN